MEGAVPPAACLIRVFCTWSMMDPLLHACHAAYFLFPQLIVCDRL